MLAVVFHVYDQKLYVNEETEQKIIYVHAKIIGIILSGKTNRYLRGN